jgi:hypothetical protein
VAGDFDGSTGFLSGPAPVTSAPMSIAAWVKLDDVTDECIISLANAGAGANINRIRILAGVVHARSQGAGGGGVSSTSAGTVSAGTWAHVGGVFASTSSRIAYLNGTGAAAETSTRTPSGIDTLSVGVNFLTAGHTEFSDGLIAEVGVWSAALDAAEMAALGKGVSPLLIRPASLAHYSPLVREFINYRGAALSKTGTVNVGDHCNVFMPSRQRFTTKAAAGGAAAVSRHRIIGGWGGRVIAA